MFQVMAAVLLSFISMFYLVSILPIRRLHKDDGYYIHVLDVVFILMLSGFITTLWWGTLELTVIAVNNSLGV